MNFSTILIISILVCVFRLPILASVSFSAWTPLLNILPLFFILIHFSLELAKKESRSLFLELCHEKVYIISFFSIVYFLFFSCFKFFTDRENSIFILRELSSTTIFLLFPLLIDFYFSKGEIKNLLLKIFSFVIVIAFGLTFVEFILLKLNLFSVSDLYIWLWKSRPKSAVRINTFMGQGAVSGITSLAGLLYLLPGLVEDFFQGNRIKYWRLFLIILALMTILFCDSFTLLFSLGLVSSLIVIRCYLQIRKKRIFSKKFKFTIFAIFIGLFLSINVLLKISGLRERYIAYVYMKQIIPVLGIYYPKFSTCTPLSFLTGLPYSSDQSACTPGEFHGLSGLFKYGILLQFGWFAFYFYPIWKLFKKRIKFKDYLSETSFYPILGILITFLHYSGVELWGNNYIFGLLMVVIIKRTRNQNNSKLQDM